MIETPKFPNNFIEHQFVPYFEKSEISLLVHSLANTISKKYKGQDLVIVGVLKGSLCFVSDLVRAIKGVNIIIDFIKITSVGRAKGDDGIIQIQKDISVSTKGKNVLIVEDIVDSARALKFIVDRVNLSEPSSVSVISLFDKPYHRKAEVTVDYVGKKIDNLFVIGYGLDLEGYGRNLEEIYYLKYPN